MIRQNHAAEVIRYSKEFGSVVSSLSVLSQFSYLEMKIVFLYKSFHFNIGQ